MGTFAAWLVEHGAALAALGAALRSVVKARAMREQATADAIRAVTIELARSSDRLASAEERERECAARCEALGDRLAATEARCTEAEARGESLAREMSDLRRALRSDGR